MNWYLHAFEALSPRDLYLILQARSAVFVVEQKCAYLDPDGKDLHAEHLYALDESGAEPRLAACLRLLPPGISYAEASIGRVVTSADDRGTGLGRELMQRALQRATQRWPQSALRIGAQLYLKAFYSSLGFVATGEVYDEDGIAHIEMLRR